jgi:hypothetical protein
VAYGGYFVGGMDGEVCEPKKGATAGTAYWLPTEDICIHASAGAGVGYVTYSPTPLFQDPPGADGDPNTFESRVQRLSGVTYEATLINDDTGGFGTVKVPMHSYTAAQLDALQAKPALPTHKMYYGALVRAGSLPYGMYSPGTSTVDAVKGQDIIDAGVQMARTGYQTIYDDTTGMGGTYSFSDEDPLITWLLAHKIVPLMELDAGPKRYGTLGKNTAESLMHNPTEYADWCSAAATHLRATFPSLGVSVPAYFSMPRNEPNSTGGWDASQTDNPTLYAETASGPALYMKSCYAAVKKIIPNAEVYGGELATNVAGNAYAMPQQLMQWYAAGCRIGTCFDGVTLHISPIGDPSQHFKNCFETNNGWTFACLTEMQAIATSHGDPTLHAMITETEMTSVQNSNDSAGDEPGQAWWTSQTLASAVKNPDIDGIFWANIDEDALYPKGSPFYGGSLVDTSSGTERRKEAFTTYCRFAKYPSAC